MATSLDAPPGQRPGVVPDSPGDGESSSTAYPTTRLARLGGVTARHPWRFVLVWVVITVAAFAVAVGGVTGE